MAKGGREAYPTYQEASSRCLYFIAQVNFVLGDREVRDALKTILIKIIAIFKIAIKAGIWFI